MEGVHLTTPLPEDDPRATLGLFTMHEAAHYVQVSFSTLRNWVREYAVVSSITPDLPRQPTIPFVGLTEALVISSFRSRGLRMGKIRAALEAIEREVGVAHALANQAVYTAGASILWDYARRSGDAEIGDLVEPHTGQRVFVEAVRLYLEMITYDASRWATQVELPAFRPTTVVIDLNRSFGRPILDKHRLRVEDILDRFYGGRDSISDIAADLELEADEVENVIRAAWRPAA